MRRVMYSAMFAAVSAATLAAAGVPQQVSNTNKQVTIVTRNGDRHRGTLVYHNDANLNLLENGQDRAYAIDNIVVVDFAGGDPTAAELGNLQTTIDSRDVNAHMLAMRDGAAVRGRMYTITPTAMTFNTTSGHQNYDLNNIARWYVSPSAARQMYASILNAPPAPTPPPAPAPPATATPGAAVPAGAIGNIRVEANRPWNDTGINVRKGDRLVFSATGQISIRQGGTEAIGPDGSPTEARNGAPSQAIGVGGLIGRVANGQIFAIGSSSAAITMPAAGRLFLGVNDAGTADNSGAFVVSIGR